MVEVCGEYKDSFRSEWSNSEGGKINYANVYSDSPLLKRGEIKFHFKNCYKVIKVERYFIVLFYYCGR